MTKILERRSPKRANKPNPHTGSGFDEFLVEEGIFEEVQAKALKRALAEQLEEAMVAAKLTKIRMAEKMKTSRSQLDRVLDPDNVSIQLDTLIKAARALGKTVQIQISKGANPAFHSDETSLGVIGVAGAGRTRRSGLSKLPRLLGRNKTWSVPE
jgi:antitoxin HicB